MKLNFRPDALRAIAEEAARRNSGARGLRAILEEVMLDVMYEIPSLSGVKECVVTREDGRVLPLGRRWQPHSRRFPPVVAQRSRERGHSDDVPRQPHRRGVEP